MIGRKVGMTQVFDERGTLTPVTVVKIEDNVVIGERTLERDGYTACILGSIDSRAGVVSRPVSGQFPEGTSAKRIIREFRDFDRECSRGDVLGVDLFKDVELVDVIGVSKGKGYQGVMKRHGFGGGRKTHGSKFHRAGGSTGMAADPSRVIKGTKMAGRMGADRVTVQNLAVVRVDEDRRVLLLRGAVPGTENGVVLVREAKKSL